MANFKVNRFIIILFINIVAFEFTGFSQQESTKYLDIEMNGIGKQVDFCFEALHPIWQLDLYTNYKKVQKDSSYFFFLPAFQSSQLEHDSLLHNIIPCAVVKAKEKIFFIANLAKDFNFSTAINTNLIFFPNDSICLKLNNKEYNFYLSIGDTLQYINTPYANFPNLDTIHSFKKIVSSIFIKISPYNRKTGAITLSNKKFNLTAIDVNYNGCYNDIGIDKISITSRNNDKIFDVGFIPYREDIFFKINDTSSIVLKNISSNGNKYSTIIQSNSSTFSTNNNIFPELQIVDTISNFNFSIIPIGNKELKDCFYGKPYLLIYQWGLWCSGCYNETNYLLDNYSKLSQYMNIIGFNYKDDDIKKVYEYINLKKIPWQIAFSTKNIYKTVFKSMGFPSAILIRNDFTIQKYFAGTDYLNFFIKSEKPHTIITK